ncbi:PREDICTED: phosphatidylglycerol/phosphatidylinositol transfer protein-like [Amphimedon queenslandica]|uniref:MD-2-related lipid-recognition domain-containing protein n=1 Tax=Amphimedon queenslandica TaxID=400682 RepID=A0A1X7VWJ3_AMPQE|nr:PREDICTED: phosphatidylglycerol/phosphatidylinositol transfer protein-like [Amphimedon queenslandica]|eukprot:XP_011402569.1 PREDICTED: phosphatidylglycerol/phosphatidylinositol transfer protein-like [Amphimedon queenslandica]
MVTVIKPSLFLMSLWVLSSHEAQGSGKKLSWSHCSNPGTVALNYILFKPFPLKIGQRFQYIANLSTSDTIVDGTFHVKLWYQLNIAKQESINITFIDERINLCDQWVADSGHLCPVKPGNYIMTSAETIPTLFKPGNYFGKAEAFDEAGKILICARIKFSL